MEASAAGAGKLGVMLRVPYGVVGAISPFNFPLNLVAHKLGPAIAAGNAVVLKPAGQTPISALKLAAILVEAGLPEGWLSVIPGPGSEVGNAIVEHELTRALSFTGSAGVGWGIRSRVPHKKVNLELGSNAPLIVHSDGDWETAADKAKTARLLARRPELHLDPAHPRPRGRRRRLRRAPRRQRRVAAGRRPARPRDRRRPADHPRRPRPGQGVGRRGGRRPAPSCSAGGELVDEGRCLAPTLLGSPPRDAKVWCEEIFGPVATIDRYSEFGEALRMANDSKFGLQAGVFTRDIGRGLEAAADARVRRRPDQRGADLPRRPDALRRRQGLRQHPRGPGLRRAGADRGALRHPAGLRPAEARPGLPARATRAGGPCAGGREPPRAPRARRPARARPRAASGPTRPRP